MGTGIAAPPLGQGGRHAARVLHRRTTRHGAAVELDLPQSIVAMAGLVHVRWRGARRQKGRPSPSPSLPHPIAACGRRGAKPWSNSRLARACMPAAQAARRGD